MRTIYQMTGNLAVEALVADRGDEEYGQTWCNVTVNLGRLPEPDLAFPCQPFSNAGNRCTLFSTPSLQSPKRLQ